MEKITINAIINAPIEKVWQYWTQPDHVITWNMTSPNWHTPKAENDLRVGGSFLYLMATKDGSVSFDFDGVYDAVEKHRLIAYTISDGRKVTIHFNQKEDGQTEIVEIFEAENHHPIEVQQQGWLSILNNFKKVVEAAN